MQHECDGEDTREQDLHRLARLGERDRSDEQEHEALPARDPHRERILGTRDPGDEGLDPVVGTDRRTQSQDEHEDLGAAQERGDEQRHDREDEELDVGGKSGQARGAGELERDDDPAGAGEDETAHEGERPGPRPQSPRGLPQHE